MNYNCPYMQLKGQQYENMQTFRTTVIYLLHFVGHSGTIPEGAPR